MRRRAAVRALSSMALSSMALRSTALGSTALGPTALGVMAAAIAPRAAHAFSAEQRSDFERRFDAGFGEQNLDRAMALFHWRGVSDADRDRIVGLILRDLANQLARVAWLPPGNNEIFDNDGQRMRGNLVTVARFAAEFRSPDGERRISVHDVGVYQGRALIALAEPVPDAA